MLFIDDIEHVRGFVVAFRQLLTGAWRVYEARRSTIIAGGVPLASTDRGRFAPIVERTGLDIVYLEFNPRSTARGPSNIVVVGGELGDVHRWPTCDLWAPADDGPCLIIPRILDLHFALVRGSLTTRDGHPSAANGVGIARAWSRLRALKQHVGRDQLAEVFAMGPWVAY